jgi:hypothetical protein
MAIAAAATAPSSRLLRIGRLVDLDFDRSRRLLARIVREEEYKAQQDEDDQDEKNYGSRHLNSRRFDEGTRPLLPPRPRAV